MPRSGRAGHTRALRPWSSACLGQISTMAAWCGGQGGPALCWAMFPLPQPGWRKPPGCPLLWDGQLPLGRTSYARDGRCVPGLGGALPAFCTAGWLGLIPARFGWPWTGGCRRRGWDSPPGKPTPESRRSCAARLICPARTALRAAAFVGAWRFPFSLRLSDSMPNCLDRWPDWWFNQLRISGLQAAPMPGSARQTCGQLE